MSRPINQNDEVIAAKEINGKIVSVGSSNSGEQDIEVSFPLVK